MSSTQIDAIVNEYFSRLDAFLAGLSPADREPLLAEIRAHVDEARAELPVENEASIRELLERVGAPEDIAAEALGEGSKRRNWVSRRSTRAGAVVVVLAVIAAVVGVLLTGSSAKAPKVAIAPTVSVGGFPTGVAVDTATNTTYVASGVSSALSIINDKTCNASTSAGCGATKTVSTDGQDAIGVVVDEQTHTVYAVNGGSNTLAVINAQTCNATDTSGCAKTPALVTLPAGPEFLALNEKTNTIYIANTGAGSVSVVDGKTCNATDTAGCAKTPASVRVGEGPFPVAVDESTNTVYVGTLSGVGSGAGAAFSGDVYVIDGNHCDSATTSGCSATPKSVQVGSGPAGIAVDSSSGTVYVSSEDGTVSVINGKTCDASDTAGCSTKPTNVTIESDPRGNALDPTTHTLYVTNAGSNTLSLINTSACNATDTSGCATSAPIVLVGGSPRRVAIDPATNTAYVVNVEDNTVSLINTKYCNATDQRGCPTQSPLSTATPGGFGFGSGSRVAFGPATNSSCSPTTIASSSGAPAATITANAKQVASGTIAGQSWSLWSKNGESGANGLENAGLVVNGHAYGLCPGFPNPAELELLDAGSRGIVYGVIGYPGKAKVQLSLTTVHTFESHQALPAPTVQVVNGVSFFIGTLPRSACDYSALELNSTSKSYSAEHNFGFASCVKNELVPITASQGIWQLQRGKFVNNFGAGLSLRGPTPIANVPLENSSCSPTTVASSSGGPASSLTATAREVASGTLAGQSWSLWSKTGQSGANALEDAGLVFGGRAYGLCPGYPNPAEMELLDAGRSGIVYGVIGYHGKAEIKLSLSTVGTFESGKALPSPAVRVVNGVSFFIGALPRPACDYSALELNSTSPGVSAEHNLGFSGCAKNKLVQITASQGIWQLKAGRFVNNFPGAGSFGTGARGLTTTIETCSPGATTTELGSPATDLIRTATKVATGSTDGHSWSLWANKSTPGMDGIETGGLVLDNRWYGLCPGAPNPAEFELIDTKPTGVVYGYVANPGAYSVSLNAGQMLAPADLRRVRGGTFFIEALPHSACTYTAIQLEASTPSVNDMRYQSFAGCQPNKLVTVDGGHGSW